MHPRCRITRRTRRRSLAWPHWPSLSLLRTWYFLEGSKSAINCSLWSHRHIRHRRQWLRNYTPQSTINIALPSQELSGDLTTCIMSTPYPPTASCLCSSHVSNTLPPPHWPISRRPSNASPTRLAGGSVYIAYTKTIFCLPTGLLYPTYL